MKTLQIINAYNLSQICSFVVVVIFVCLFVCSFSVTLKYVI